MPELEALIRLAAALVCGAVVGVERQWHHKNAGVKTHALVALGSATVGLVSVRGFGVNSVPTQLAVGVITGVGFIGGGVIMHRSGGVQGLTTAATLWATASMGLVFGGGFYLVGGFVFSGMLLIQLLLPKLDTWVGRRSAPSTPSLTYHLTIQFDPAAEESVRPIWTDFVSQLGSSILDWSETRTDTGVSLEVGLALPPPRMAEVSGFTKRLAALAGVSRVVCSATTPIRGD